MSTQVFPSLTGEEWDVKRTPIWDGTTVQESISGKRRAINNWSAPRYGYELSFAVLPDTVNLNNAPATADLQTLLGFFNARNGPFDTFLYSDISDNTVTGQGIGTGDGATQNFQLVRAYGGYVESILAPNTVSAVYINSSSQASSLWSVTGWGSTATGVVSFVTPPSSGATLTADFTFYFPARFDTPSLTFNNFLSHLHEAKSVKFSTEK